MNCLEYLGRSYFKCACGYPEDFLKKLPEPFCDMTVHTNRPSFCVLFYANDSFHKGLNDCIINFSGQ